MNKTGRALLAGNSPKKMTNIALRDLLDAGLEELVETVAARTAELVLQRLTSNERMADEPSHQGLLNVGEAAAYLSLSVSSMYKLSSSGRLTSVKMGGRLRFRRSDLDRYVAGHRRGQNVVEELARKARF